MNTVRLQTSLSSATPGAPAAGTKRVGPDPATAACAALVAFPFLSPLVAGPSVNVWQLLGAWVCVAALTWIGGAGRGGVPARALLCWLGVVLGALAWRQHDGGHTDAPNMASFLRWAARRLPPR
jgi:hypothetical protein